MPGVERRDVLRMSAVAGATGALTLSGVSFARAADGSEKSRTVKGHLPTGAPDFVYLPVDVPSGVREIEVAYTYDKPSVPEGTKENALDIGVFDERGTALGGRGFRGWSGGARDRFTISAEKATPGYLAGPVRAGTWHIALGPYTVAPQGMDYEVTVTLRYGPPGTTPRPVHPPERARGRGRAWYRGDCHLHTVYSDGKRTPAQAAAAAREAGLDFIATTEHNTTSGHGAWEGLWDEEFLILCGEEITTRNGHVVALGTDPGRFFDWRYRAGEDRFPRFARQVRRAGGLVVPAHPNCPFVGCQWKFGYAEADAIEVWNGPWTTDDELAVAAWDNMLTAPPQGRGPVPAMGNSDAHAEPQKVGLPQTVVLAEDLSRQALLEGIRAGRSYIAESSEISLSLTAHSGHGEHAGIGERLAVRPEAEVTVRLEVSGAPAGATARLLTDEGEMFAAAVSDKPLEWRTTASLAPYVRAEIRHRPPVGSPPDLPGAMAAMTNPVWLGHREG
ncbi:hypothetical protein K378_02450 [Streptomyces sp. Amel2xB2]|uniref:CehA/McbA family metallohydrolase n=1 Tax=Streptomyces sp. Amel2xB2 TaxID=1305829 RepID=UPI000DB9729C|nr:CehA/McbA family metallohydrolase [Streptomyces sp. Amel2xB2]RAJ67084.1 hypothetical protein K378_02450 [Streptomyces sp. Amel2xB2]